MIRGRFAALPPPGWSPPARSGQGGLLVRVFPEDGGAYVDYDFAVLPVALDLQLAFAEAFARLTAPDGPYRAASTAKGRFAALRRFALRLAATSHPPHRPQELSPAHLAELRLAKPRDYSEISGLLRAVSGVTPGFAGALLEVNPRRQSSTLASYTNAEWRAIMSAARGQLRDARSRIRSGWDLLARWRAGEFLEGTFEWIHGQVLDHVAKTGDVPRRPGGKQLYWCDRQGGAKRFVSELHLTVNDMIAGMVLLVGLTGHNHAGVNNLTVNHHRADADDTTSTTRVAIVDMLKPRRGRRKRYMTVPLCDVPGWLSLGMERAGADDLSSPFGVFDSLCELTAGSRDITGSNRLFIARAVRGGGRRHWVLGVPHGGTAKVWARDSGLRTGGEAGTAPGEGETLSVTWPRLRLTFVQHHQRGVAHSDRVMAEQYLVRDRGNIDEYRKIVADTLAEQDRRAREFGVVRSLGDVELAQARRDPRWAAGVLGIDVETVKVLLAGILDTALAACVDEEHSPYTPQEQPCRASFLLCLGCPNARATPTHLPVQALAHQKILELRDSVPPERWARRFGLAEAQLCNLLAQFSSVRIEAALGAATETDRDVVGRLLAGQLETP